MKRLRIIALLMIGACGGADSVQPTIAGPSPVEPGAMLSDARVAGAGVQWQQYIVTSKRWARVDSDSLAQEMQRAGVTTWSAAKVGTDFRIPYAPNNSWYASGEARALAMRVITYQTPAGGWSKAIDFAAPRQTAQSYASDVSWHWIGTFDNGATTEELRLLAEVLRVQNVPALVPAFDRGMQYVFDAQLPNGCWPQVYPLEGSYHDAATLNDNMMVNIISFLSGITSTTFTTQDQRSRASTALSKALQCLLDAQIKVGAALTAWAQQFDPITLQPVVGRAYEPVAIVTMESAPVMDVFMSSSAQDSRIVDALRAAAHWFEQTRLPDGQWARFYEIGTNRPIFGDRDGSVHYNVKEISEERQSGYAWYVTNPSSTLQRYEIWSRSH